MDDVMEWMDWVIGVNIDIGVGIGISICVLASVIMNDHDWTALMFPSLYIFQVLVTILIAGLRGSRDLRTKTDVPVPGLLDTSILYCT
jgi:hypothetical protein